MNNSFNRHGIATISSPRQAIEHLLEGCMDFLIISNFIISFKDNRKSTKISGNLINEKQNLIKLCENRYKKKYFLNKKDKNYYLKSFKKIREKLWKG